MNIQFNGNIIHNTTIPKVEKTKHTRLYKQNSKLVLI